MEVVIGVDVSELSAELEAVLAPQVGEIVLKIENGVVVLLGAATPTTQITIAKTGADVDGRKASRTRDAGIEGIALTIGEKIGIVGNEGLVRVAEAKAKVVQHSGAGGPNPVRSDGIRAYRIPVLPVFGGDGVIFSIAKVVTDQHHAIKGVQAVQPVINLSYFVVAGVGIGETAVVRRGLRWGVLDQSSGTRVWWRWSTSHQFQADGARRHAARLEHIEGVYHAV